MPNKKVAVIVRIKAKPDMGRKVRQELMSLVAPTRSEAGCINYDLHQGTDDEAYFCFTKIG